MISREFHDRLAARAQAAGLEIAPRLAADLETYFLLLAKWNRTINLSGMSLDDAAPETIDRLLIEPLLAARHAGRVTRMIDIGSGGGSPAIPMALSLRPSVLTMVESRGRKAVFLAEAARAVALDSVRVVNARYETLLDDPDFTGRFDLLTIRAVRITREILESLRRLLRPEAAMMVFTRSGADTIEAPASLHVRGSHTLSALLGSRVVVLESANTPDNVPRGTI